MRLRASYCWNAEGMSGRGRRRVKERRQGQRESRRVSLLYVINVCAIRTCYCLCVCLCAVREGPFCVHTTNQTSSHCTFSPSLDFLAVHITARVHEPDYCSIVHHITAYLSHHSHSLPFLTDERRATLPTHHWHISCVASTTGLLRLASTTLLLHRN